jgi:hypothetical protein
MVIDGCSNELPGELKELLAGVSFTLRHEHERLAVTTGDLNRVVLSGCKHGPGVTAELRGLESPARCVESGHPVSLVQNVF